MNINRSALYVSILILVALSTIDALTFWEQFKRRPSSLAVSRHLGFSYLPAATHRTLELPSTAAGQAGGNRGQSNSKKPGLSGPKQRGRKPKYVFLIDQHFPHNGCR